ncbi:MAG: hypothetical protein GKR77_03995 [Legionellales bacterium]|nr:hypothetical protein [Legionellales bacterium]
MIAFDQLCIAIKPNEYAVIQLLSTQCLQLYQSERSLSSILSFYVEQMIETDKRILLLVSYLARANTNASKHEYPNLEDHIHNAQLFLALSAQCNETVKSELEKIQNSREFAVRTCASNILQIDLRQSRVVKPDPSQSGVEDSKQAPASSRSGVEDSKQAPASSQSGIGDSNQDQKDQLQAIKQACNRYLEFRRNHAPGHRFLNIVKPEQTQGFFCLFYPQLRTKYWHHGSSGIKRVQEILATDEYPVVIQLTATAYSRSGTQQRSFSRFLHDELYKTKTVGQECSFKNQKVLKPIIETELTKLNQPR